MDQSTHLSHLPIDQACLCAQPAEEVMGGRAASVLLEKRRQEESQPSSSGKPHIRCSGLEQSIWGGRVLTKDLLRAESGIRGLISQALKHTHSRGLGESPGQLHPHGSSLLCEHRPRVGQDVLSLPVAQGHSTLSLLCGVISPHQLSQRIQYPGVFLPVDTKLEDPGDVPLSLGLPA